MQRCRAKESELLEFTQRLTETNVRLQSELATLQEKVSFIWLFKMNLHNNLLKIGQAQSLEIQRDEILVKLEEAERKWKNVKLELQHEQENRSGEAAAWTRTVSEKSRLCEDLQTQVRELQNELASVRRKHAINLKVSQVFFRRYLPILFQWLIYFPGIDTGIESDQETIRSRRVFLDQRQHNSQQ